MKKVLFALPILALALFLSFCAKEQSRPGNAALAPTETGASERGSGGESEACDVTITATGTVEVCGLSTNGQACTDCYNVNRPGREVGTNFSYSIVPTYPDVPFSIRNTGNATVQVTVSTPAFGCAVWVLAPGACEQFGLATTCLLFNTRPGFPCK